MQYIMTLLKIEICYPKSATEILSSEFMLPTGSTIAQALTHIDFWDGYSAVGIFGKHMPLDTVLKSGDRIEIYRPRVRDPKTARRIRAGIISRSAKTQPDRS
jgi:putative ubiquitin-RnfH superfamily antitoxin RatB of RatAB toxin-antitoxin module